jgi:hypothetical protein
MELNSSLLYMSPKLTTKLTRTDSFVVLPVLAVSIAFPEFVLKREKKTWETVDTESRLPALA